jgi:hypothetical protein
MVDLSAVRCSPAVAVAVAVAECSMAQLTQRPTHRRGAQSGLIITHGTNVTLRSAVMVHE